MSEIIPAPINFNPYKHHLYFINNRIKLWQNEDWSAAATGIIKIGSNMLDLYTGKLTVEAICNECLHFFSQKNINSKEKFMEWLKPSAYKRIELSDRSVWIIKEGTEFDRYIHIHPAKNTTNSIRVRATTLKTVIAMKVILRPATKRINIHEVNRIRRDYLKLSLIKSIQSGKGISRLWQLFNSR